MRPLDTCLPHAQILDHDNNAYVAAYTQIVSAYLRQTQGAAGIAPLTLLQQLRGPLAVIAERTRGGVLRARG